MVSLFVTDLEFYAYHGVPPEEQVVGHRYIVDLVIDVACTADTSDRVEDTVDYAAAAKVVVETATHSQYKTVERLARVICEKLFEQFQPIEKVSIRLAKRLPPAPIIAKEVGVSLQLSRNEIVR